MVKFGLIQRAILVFCLALSPAVRAAPATQPASTQPVWVPYRLTDTNHILIRLKVNGKGPFNFIVDTGAPAMFLRVPAATKVGLKADPHGFAKIDELEIEGGVKLKNVQCFVNTPYQIEGMNAIGASGVDLDGLLGYAVLARFRLQIDMSKDRMLWTPLDFVPPPLVSGRSQQKDQREDNLESTGTLLKVLGPLIKPRAVAPEYRGFLGIELAEKSGVVSVLRVLGDSPADKAGIDWNDRLISVNDQAVKTIADAQSAMAKARGGQAVSLVLQRGDAKLKLKVTCTEGL